MSKTKVGDKITWEGKEGIFTSTSVCNNHYTIKWNGEFVETSYSKDTLNKAWQDGDLYINGINCDGITNVRKTATAVVYGLNPNYPGYTHPPSSMDPTDTIVPPEARFCEEDSNKSKKVKKPIVDKPPIVGKCPKCHYGNLVALFGLNKYCDSCEYKE